MPDPIADSLKTRFGAGLRNVTEFRGETTLHVKPEALVEVCTFLRDDPAARYDFLSDVSAADVWPDEPRFQVNYHIYSMTRNTRLRLKVSVREDQAIPSVTGVWPAANWFERETYDLFGVKFTGHPDLRRILLPDDYLGHPLRRDAPLVVEEVEFSYNYDDVEARKPYAKE
ncbi:MAG TPA: NADH-quinone oxidoreductase subunit C [Anaerolineae bacterium]|nr:NADH-quinone oxidoreductase subunit C [Anaerolineae bacterium]